MACDTAFRVIARRHLVDLTRHHDATCKGDPVALHRMRMALTHLRTAILFFSPMVADATRTRVKVELKWLNAHLGIVRDLDVAIERLKAIDKRRPQAAPHYRAWTTKRAEIHRHLARALRSARYQRLVKSASDWIERGPWSINEEKQAVLMRASPVAAYSLRKLARWQEKLLKKSRKLVTMGVKKRHRVRILNKKLSYSIGSFEDLFSDKKFSRYQTALKYLRKAQKSLGQLNDGARGHSLAAALEREGVRVSFQFLSHKREKRLIQEATAAYRNLAALE
ncbi:MAG: CHAD domain-containing protein [Bradyrhizobium sp.]|uniref:CHAD domain-containing protein n=1 Tax=Bradyrhizobium sp. TaxID=376 RepID=UPI0027310B90|nr:CHAD domain-containing protein [Bradyrhizobium sp.]MDP1868235.1 CHAD domain-containing protein [Bradyrhizobium sp.]